MNFSFEKNFGGGSLCTGGAAGIWAMHIFRTTYFDEISIFWLSKDQTFRIWSTFMNPEQFLILVPYLILWENEVLFCNYSSKIFNMSRNFCILCCINQNLHQWICLCLWETWLINLNFAVRTEEVWLRSSAWAFFLHTFFLLLLPIFHPQLRCRGPYKISAP